MRKAGCPLAINRIFKFFEKEEEKKKNVGENLVEVEMLIFSFAAS